MENNKEVEDKKDRELRRECLEYALNQCGSITPASSVIDIASEYEDYIKNGKKE